MVSLGLHQMHATMAMRSARADERRTAVAEQSLIRERITSATAMPAPLVQITMDYLADDIVRRYVRSNSNILSLPARITGCIKQLNLPNGTTVTLHQLDSLANQYGELTELTAKECRFNFSASKQLPSTSALFIKVVRLDLSGSELTGFMLAHIGRLFPQLQTLDLTSCTLDKSYTFDKRQVTTALGTSLSAEERTRITTLKIEGLPQPYTCPQFYDDAYDG